MAVAHGAALALLLAAAPAFAEGTQRPEMAHDLTPATIARDGDRLSATGAVCRRAFAAGTPRFVRLDVFDDAGAVVATHTTPVRGMPGYRGGCGFYVFADAPVAGGLRIRFMPLRRR